MGRADYFTWSMCLGVVSLFTTQVIRVRLKKCHPELFAKLGNPSFRDSNLTKAYWLFQRFVWWGHLSEPKDSVLSCLCVLTSVANVAGVVVFFFLV